MKWTMTALAAAMLTAAPMPAPAQRKPVDPAQAPMRALANALAVLAPMPGQAPRTLAQLRAVPSGIRWLPRPVDGGGLVAEGQHQVGTMGRATIFAPVGGPVTSLEFYWQNPPGRPLGFDPVAAMKRRGFHVRTAICQNDGMITEIWRWYEVTLPGRQTTSFYVHAFDAPMGGSMAIWNIVFDLTGRKPSLAEANAGMVEPLYTDRCAQE